nr:hypothetical protein CFP56_27150 [Quercus suber]
MNGRLEFLAAALLPLNGEFCCLSYRMSCYLDYLDGLFFSNYIYGAIFNIKASTLFSLSFLGNQTDGLARAKASGAADADFAIGIRCCFFRDWLCIGIFPDDDANIRWRCGSHHIGDSPQLAFLQSSPAQVVGPQRGREASQAATAAGPGREFEEETR